MGLIEDTQTFLEAEQYSVTARPARLLVGHRESVVGGGRDYIYVWVPSPSSGGGLPERHLMREFAQADEEQPRGSKYLLVETREGLTQEFHSDIRKYFGVNVRTPAQFFDTTYKWDGNRTAVTAAKTLRDRGEQLRRERIAQPYERLNGVGEEGEDLLPVLAKVLRSRDESVAPIQVVIGPAGAGKSVLFASLFSELYDSFQDDKRAQIPARRPFPLLPEYMDASRESTVRGLLGAFRTSDFSRPLSEDGFIWKLTHGYGVWLLDGLDELIGRDATFFDYLLEILTTPEATTPPLTLICLRDSLYSTNAELRDFVLDTEEYVATYVLREWGQTSKHAYANRRLGESAGDYIGILDSREDVDSLASLPYYSSLIVDLYQEGHELEDLDESTLLDVALGSIIDREREKGLIEERLISNEALMELLEDLSAEDMTNDFSGVGSETLREYAQLVSPEDVSEGEREALVTQLMQFALFVDSDQGRIRFGQELIEHYLLSQHLLRVLDKDRSLFRQRLSHVQLPPRWLTMRLLGSFVERAGRGTEMFSMAYESIGQGVVFRNLLQLGVLGGGDDKVLSSIPLERQNLSGVSFQDVDLSHVSLRACDLTDTEFQDCNLTETEFEDAVIKNTAFLGSTIEEMTGADFGSLAGFYSLRLSDSEVISDSGEAGDWIENATARPKTTIVPCASALQLRHVFKKFVYPNGQARRHWLQERAILAGRRYVSDPSILVEAATRHGYLEHERDRHRYLRPGGDAYSELVNFVSSLEISPGIRAVLNDSCDQEGCKHLVQSGPGQ